MRYTLCGLLACLSFLAASAQPLQRGIRNTGYLGDLQVSVAPAGDSLPSPGQGAGSGLRLAKRLTLVDLYPGAAAIRQSYTWMNAASATKQVIVSPTEPLPTSLAGIGTLYVLGPQVMRWENTTPGDGVPVTGSSAPGPGQRALVLSAGQTATVSLHALLQTNLSRFLSGDASRDGNALAIALAGSMAGADSATEDEILVRMNEGINLTNIWGILPAGKTTGNLQYLRFVHQGRAADSLGTFLLWYDGAPPDFKFDKKVVPIADTLFAQVDAMPLALFGDPGFKAMERQNFSLAPSGLTLTGILYFVLFSVPWIILAWFVVSMLRRRKKTGTPGNDQG